MSSKAFGLTAYYDAMIAGGLILKINFPERKTIFGRKLQKLRYGENPHQKALYMLVIMKIRGLDSHKFMAKN